MQVLHLLLWSGRLCLPQSYELLLHKLILVRAQASTIRYRRDAGRTSRSSHIRSEWSRLYDLCKHLHEPHSSRKRNKYLEPARTEEACSSNSQDLMAAWMEGLRFQAALLRTRLLTSSAKSLDKLLRGQVTNCSQRYVDVVSSSPSKATDHLVHQMTLEDLLDFPKSHRIA